MTVNDFRRSFDCRSSTNRGMQRSSDETKGAASSGPIAKSATTLTADNILLLADGPAGSLKGPNLLFWGKDGKVRFRRISPIPVRTGDGPLTLMSEVKGRGSDLAFRLTAGRYL